MNQQPPTGDPGVSTPTSLSTKKFSQVLTENNVAMVFGVHWSPVTSDVRLGKQLEIARQDGYVNYVVNSYQDTVGLIGELPAGLKQAYSAAIILSLQFSSGGTELFIFQQGDLFGLVGLVEYSPMPGFDAIGTEQDIKGLAEEFKLLNASQLLRFYGNVAWFPDCEPLELAKLALKAASTKNAVRPIPHVKRLMALIAASLLVLGGVYACYSYYQGILEEQEAAIQASLQDPNRLYEAAIAMAIKTTGSPGGARVFQWRDLFDKLPLTVNGWAITTVTCTANQCEVKWERISGDLNDFEAALPEVVKGKTQFKLDRGLVNSELRTTHDLNSFTKIEGTEKTIDRDVLPNLKDAQYKWGSQLQNISLLPKTVINMTPPVLFGESLAGIEVLNKPLVKGTWTLEHDLWSLPDLVIPNFVVPGKLTIQIDFKTGFRYKLEGDYYAKGK